MLGSSKELRASGRYATLMGNWWRHPKRQEIGRAAAGLFTDMLSFCADQATDRLTLRQVRLVSGSDPNVRRHLRALEKAQLIEPLKDGGYAIQNWYLHNRVTSPVKLRIVRETDGFDFEAAEGGCDEGVMDLRWTCDEGVMSAGAGIIEESTPLLKTQDPGPSTDLKKEDLAAAAPSAPMEPEALLPTEAPKPALALAPKPPETPRERIATLEAAYAAPALLAETREGIALSRKHGRIADNVWLTVLERLAKHPAAAALHAMRTFVDQHADGDKGEGYLLAIARNTARQLETGGGRTAGLRKARVELRAPTSKEVEDGEAWMRTWGTAAYRPGGVA